MPLPQTYSERQQTVLCHGCFDVLHTGHIYHLRQAAQLGSHFVVSITHEEHAKRKLHFSSEVRKMALESLSFVNEVIVSHSRTAIDSIQKVQPDFYVKGKEYEDLELDMSGDIYLEKQAVESVGGKLVFTDDVVQFSATKLKHRGGAFVDISEHHHFALTDVLSFIKKSSELKVCVIGETIIDRWTPVSSEGISSKSTCPTALVEGPSEDQLGGAYVIARHLKGFVKQLDLMTFDFTSIYKDALDPDINHIFYTKGHIIKERFYVPSLNTKVFELKHHHLESVFDVENKLKDYDLVIVADFGHNMISKTSAAKISEQNLAYLSVMAQSNSSNLGFNRIDKYPQADLYCIDTKELKLCLNLNEKIDWETHLKEVSRYIDFQRLVVTRGPEGALHYENDKILSFPALSRQVVDPIGAGDAFFALASLASCLKLSSEAVLLMGSLAGALNTQWLCNAQAITKSSLLETAKKVI